ncbi:MAG: DUF4292 domain-containing protein [Candidatus Binataceae bacterium]
MIIARSLWRRMLAAIVALALSGCAATVPVAPPPAAPAVSAEEIHHLMQALRVRDEKLLTLRSPAVMEYASSGGHVKAREQIIARRPDSLRVEASSPFGVALIVAVSGTQLEIFEPGRNLLLYGSATAATLNRFARIPMTPQAAVRLLMGLAPEPIAAAGKPAARRDANGLTILSYRASDGTEYENGFLNGELATARARDADGRVRYEIRYANYQDIGGLMFPYKINADFPQAASSLDLSYQRPIVNGDIPSALFTLKPAPNTRKVDLDRVQTRAAGKSG